MEKSDFGWFKINILGECVAVTPGETLSTLHRDTGGYPVITVTNFDMIMMYSDQMYQNGGAGGR